VVALDLSGNEGTKVVTVGGVTQGGTIQLTEPELQLTTDTVSQDVEQGGNATFAFKLTNVGTGEAEARMTANAPDNVTLTWSSPTVRVPSGQSVVASLDAQTTNDIRPGHYTIVTVATYKSGTTDKDQRLSVGLVVQENRPVPVSPLRQARADATDDDFGDNQDTRKSPDAGPVFLVFGAAAVAVAAARRRRDA